MSGGLSVEIAARGTGGPCAGCGKPTSDARGFVYDDGNADAAYFASWSECTPGMMKLAVAIGDWDEGGGRRAVLLDAVAEPERIRFAVTDPADSPWRTLGTAQPMTREESLSDPAIDHVFDIVDAIVREDPDISRLLEA